MIKDERILKDRNEIQAWGFKVCASILMVGLLYRQFYLDQDPGEYWDIFLALFGSVIFVNLTTWARGATSMQGERGTSLPWSGKRAWRIAFIVVVVVAISYWRGTIEFESATDVVKAVAAAVIGITPVVVLFYYLGRRWKRRSGLGQ